MSQERVLKGSGGSAGIAHGPALVLQRTHACPERQPQGRPAEEWAAFEAAREEALVRVDVLLGEARALSKANETPDSRESSGSPDAHGSLGIFESHKLLLCDPLLVDLVRSEIFTAKVSAGFATWTALARIRSILERVQDPHIAEKTADIDSVRGLLLEGLGGASTTPTSSGDEGLAGAIIVAPLLSPQDVLRFVRANVAGIVCEQGSRNSHVAILARNFNLPAVLGAKGAMAAAGHAQPRIFLVDGTQSQVLCDPSPETLRKYEARKAYWKMLGKELHERARLPAVTSDGHAVSVLANADASMEIPAVRSSHADGVGLFRLESFYMAKSALPTEDEIFEEISLLAKAFPEKSVTVRLLDAGGDKTVPALDASLLARGLVVESEALTNPLGLRGVRILLRDRALLRLQCRAIVRANVRGNVRIMVPFVTGVEEMSAVREELAEAWQELARDEGAARFKMPLLGAMIETPAAASIAVLLASEVAFFSIGTNDLTQHTLVVDRTSADVAPLYEAAHPAILRLLAATIQAATEAKIPVSLCGEMAADPLFAELLVGLGLRQLSCSPHAIPLVKEAVRGVDSVEARRFVAELMGIRTVAAFKARLHARFAERFAAGTIGATGSLARLRKSS